MTAPYSLNPAALLEKGLSDASPDLLRHLLSTVVNALLSAEADAVCGRGVRPARPGAGELPQRLPPPRAGHPGRHHRRRDPQARWPSNTTNGPRAAATSDSTSWPAPQPSTHPPNPPSPRPSCPSWSPPHEQHPQSARTRHRRPRRRGQHRLVGRDRPARPLASRLLQPRHRLEARHQPTAHARPTPGSPSNPKPEDQPLHHSRDSTRSRSLNRRRCLRSTVSNRKPALAARQPLSTRSRHQPTRCRAGSRACERTNGMHIG